ncbi:MAG: 50S ribosomal protein L21 [Patescibacteria group bacterium]
MVLSVRIILQIKIESRNVQRFMKKAIIQIQGKQHLVTEGQELVVDRISSSQKSIVTEPLLVIEEKDVKIGNPNLKDSKVTLDIIDQEIKGEKVLAIRYKPKKRVHKVRGHRQSLSKLLVKKIA